MAHMLTSALVAVLVSVIVLLGSIDYAKSASGFELEKATFDNKLNQRINKREVRDRFEGPPSENVEDFGAPPAPPNATRPNTKNNGHHGGPRNEKCRSDSGKNMSNKPGQPPGGRRGMGSPRSSVNNSTRPRPGRRPDPGENGEGELPNLNNSTGPGSFSGDRREMGPPGSNRREQGGPEGPPRQSGGMDPPERQMEGRRNFNRRLLKCNETGSSEGENSPPSRSNKSQNFPRRSGSNPRIPTESAVNDY